MRAAFLFVLVLPLAGQDLVPAPKPIPAETKVQVVILQRQAEQVAKQVAQLDLQRERLVNQFRELNQQLNEIERKIRQEAGADETWLLTPDLLWMKKKAEAVEEQK